MTRTTTRAGASPRPRGDDRGAVTLFLCIAAIGLLALAGLVVDGGAKVRATQRADRLAAEAARAVGQAVNVSAVLSGTAVRVDARAALAAAQDYLDAAGSDGTVAVEPDGRSIRVSTAATSHTVFLGLVGVPEITVRGTATVQLIQPGRTGQP